MNGRSNPNWKMRRLRAAIVAVTVGGGIGLAAGPAANEAPNPLVNSGFDVPERAYIRPQTEPDFEGGHAADTLPGWTIDAAGEQVILTDLAELPGFEASGDTWLRFSEPDDGFGDNRLEQFIELDGHESLQVLTRVTTHQPVGKDFGDPLSVRVQARFLDAGDGQVGDDIQVTGHLVQRDVAGNDGAGDVTLELDPLELVTLPLEVDELPEGATRVRLRVSVRDRTDGGFQPEGPRFIFLDRVEVLGDGGAALNVANHDFSDTGGVDRDAFFGVVVPFPDDDQGPLGWHITDMENDQYADPVPAGVIRPEVHLDAPFEAHGGDRVWRWQALGPDFGDDNLDQCFSVANTGNTDFSLAVWARSPRDWGETDVVRLGVQGFADLDDCLAHGDNSFEHEFDFPLTEPDSWLPLVTDAITPAGSAVRISLRARDPEGTGDPIYFDSVTPYVLRVPVLTFEGDNPVTDGDLVRVEVPGLPSSGVTVYYTTDGTAPTTESLSVAPGNTITLLEDYADGEGEIQLQAVAFKDGWNMSLPALATFRFGADAPEEPEDTEEPVDPEDPEEPEAPEEPEQPGDPEPLAMVELAPAGGVFVENASVTLTTATEGGVIRYTLDGSDPSASSQSIESGESLVIDESATLIAVTELDGELSEPVSATFTIEAGIADDVLGNGDFASLNPRPAEVTYPQRGGPPGWKLVVEPSEGDNDGATVGTGDAAVGDAWFSFNLLADGFGNNKLEQCVAIDPSRPLDISYRLRADTPDDDANDLRARINPNFYASFADCAEAIDLDAGGERLSSPRSNDNSDFDLGSRGNEWVAQGPGQDSGLRYQPEDMPEAAGWMRLSVRARDRSGIDPQPRVRFDDIRVTQGSETTNRLVNGSFEQIELFDRDFLSGGEGWYVDRNGNSERRAVAGPADFALVGSNVFYFEDLTGDFADSRLEQCVALGDGDIRPALFLRSSEPADGLELQLAVDFFADEDCAGEADAELAVLEDTELMLQQGSWQGFSSETSRSAEAIDGMQSALLSVRLRDGGGNQPMTLSATGQGGGAIAATGGRRVFIDGVSVAAGGVLPPVFSPADSEFQDSIDVTLSTASEGALIYYTLDGSDPDFDSESVASGETITLDSTTTVTARAGLEGQLSSPRSATYTRGEAAAPEPEQEAQGTLRGSGCSATGQPGPFDPTLWLLMLFSGLGLMLRGRGRWLA